MTVRLIHGDCRTALAELEPGSVHCCVTSPPYFGLRDYGHAGQMGLEATPDAYVAEIVGVFREVRRVLRRDGTVFLNLGDSYFGGGRGGNPTDSPHQKQRTNRGSVSMPASAQREVATTFRHGQLKPKDLLGIPWMVAFALRADGWYLRQDCIWHKPNPMPESVTDRCTKAHEYLFLLSKSKFYHFDAAAIAEPASFSNLKGLHNKRSVWTVASKALAEAHFATFPPKLIEPCILAGCSKGGTVLDPFAGAGTVGLVAQETQRNAILIELNPDYLNMIKRRLNLFPETALA